MLAQAAVQASPAPNLDRLASTGAKFTQAASRNVMCTPSRGLAGPVPQNHLVSFLLHDRRNGYKTAAI
jgi:hypothetical protein